MRQVKIDGMVDWRENPGTFEWTAEVGRLRLLVQALDESDTAPARWVISTSGLDQVTRGEAESVGAAKTAAVEAVPAYMAKVTAWLYEGTPAWVIDVAKPARQLVTDPVALCRRLGQERGVSMDPTLVGRDVPVLSPEHEGRIIAEYGLEALVRYYCPNDPRLRTARPKAGGVWMDCVEGSVGYQVIGIGRFYSDPYKGNPVHDAVHMAEVVMYGRPGDPLIRLRTLDEFMSGRFLPADATFTGQTEGNRPEARLIPVDEDCELVDRDDGESTGRACASCGAFVGSFHMVGCPGIPS